MGAVAVVFAVGVGLAVAQPGDLGDDDEGAATATTLGEATTTSGDGTTTSVDDGTTTTDDETTTTESTTTTVDSTTSTTAAPTTDPTVEGSTTGSTDSSGDVDPSLAESGGESLALPALGVGALGLALRRLRGGTRPS